MRSAGSPVQAAVPDDRKSAVLAELARIVSSPAFKGSRRCCRFLDYSIQHVLLGDPREDLRERSIGVDVFGRDPAYDTTEDATVRVTANEVRKRLAQYYQALGPHAGPLITLPAGSYAVCFQWDAVVTEPPPAAALVPLSRRRVTLAVVAGIVLAIVLGVVYAARQRVLPAAGKSDPLWSRVFDPKEKTNILISDTVFREMQEYIGHDLSLRDYLAPSYPAGVVAAASPAMQPVLKFLSLQQTTSVGSATMGSRLLEFGKRFGGNPVLRYPRHINAREFNTDNFILLGSHLSIPWAELFEPTLNFPLAANNQTREYFLRNRGPRAGERAEYHETADETFADIAVLPNLGGSGTVLLLNGIDMVAAESAGAFALSGGLSATLAGARYVEVLIRVRSIGGAAAKSEIVATRTVAALR